MSSRFLSRVHYRIGASYATPYIKVNGQNGPKEYSASVGFGLPINKSVLNISGQWTFGCYGTDKGKYISY